MPLSANDIINPIINDGSSLQRIAYRRHANRPITITEYNPEWPQRFLDTKARIEEAFRSTTESPRGSISSNSNINANSDSDVGSNSNVNINNPTSSKPTTLLSIDHTGSTSVPHLPAKDIIDIDLTVHNITDEPTYVPALESLGFRFLFREPGWYEHRFFVDEGDVDDDNNTKSVGYAINLHVFGAECAEVERHVIFRDWLCGHPGDLRLYADVKRGYAEAAGVRGEGLLWYTEMKGEVVREILGRAYRERGLLGG